MADLLNAVRKAFGKDELSDHELESLVSDTKGTLISLKQAYDSPNEETWPELPAAQFRPLLWPTISDVGWAATKVISSSTSGLTLKEGLSRYCLVSHSVAIDDPLVYISDYAFAPDDMIPQLSDALRLVLEFVQWVLPLVKASVVCVVPPRINAQRLIESEGSGPAREAIRSVAQEVKKDWPQEVDDLRALFDELAIKRPESIRDFDDLVEDRAWVMLDQVAESFDILRLIDEKADLFVPALSYTPAVRWWLTQAQRTFDGREIAVMDQLGRLRLPERSILMSEDIIRVREHGVFENWRTALASELETLNRLEDPLAAAELEEARRRLTEAANLLIKPQYLRGIALSPKDIFKSLAISVAGVAMVAPELGSVSTHEELLLAGGVAGAQIAVGTLDAASKFVQGRKRRKKLAGPLERHLRAVASLSSA